MTGLVASGEAARGSATANRTFWRLVAVSVSLRLVLIYGACCLVGALYDALRAGGPAGLWSGDPNPLPGLALLAAVTAGMGRALWSLGRSAWHSVAFARHVRRSAVPPPAGLAADAADLGDRLVVMRSPVPFALTYGAFRPRILLTTGLVRTLSAAEVAAVLAHEREHLRNRDPLKNVLARAILARHFYLPALAGLGDRFLAGRELFADRAASAAHGIAPLAGALLKVTGGPAWAAASPSAAMSNDALLEARIAQLETGAAPTPPRRHRARLLTVVTGLAFAAAVAWSTVIIAHFMPACLPALG